MDALLIALDELEQSLRLGDTLFSGKALRWWFSIEEPTQLVGPEHPPCCRNATGMVNLHCLCIRLKGRGTRCWRTPAAFRYSAISRIVSAFQSSPFLIEMESSEVTNVSDGKEEARFFLRRQGF